MVEILGRETRLVKKYLKDAYCLIPVHPWRLPFPWYLPGWAHLLDRALMFGLQSAPKVFSAHTQESRNIMLRGMRLGMGYTHNLKKGKVLVASQAGQARCCRATALSFRWISQNEFCRPASWVSLPRLGRGQSSTKCFPGSCGGWVWQQLWKQKWRSLMLPLCWQVVSGEWNMLVEEGYCPNSRLQWGKNTKKRIGKASAEWWIH